MSDSEDHNGDPSQPAGPVSAQEQHRRRAWQAATVIALIALLVAIGSLLRDVFDWQFRFPGSSVVESPTLVEPASSASGSSRHPSRQPSPRISVDTLPIESGESNLASLPPGLDGQPGYDRAIVIKCPSNGGADLTREVSYRVQRRYDSLSATVQPYFSSDDDRDGRVYVYALVSVRERDGTISRLERGAQFDARMGAPRQLTASVRGADELTLRVRCEFPQGWVVFTDVGLFPA